MNHSIIGFRKVKENSKLSAIAEHIFRFKGRGHSVERIDVDRSQHNEVLVNVLNVKKTSDLSSNLSKFYTNLGIKPKKDNVLAIDLVVTTSPEFWGDWQKELDSPTFKAKVRSWADEQLKIIEKAFGKNAVKTAVLHLDETTPHIHVLVTPEETKEVIFKNRHGEFKKQKTILNNNRWNPSFFKGFYNDFCEKNKELYGLERGNTKTREHKPLKEYKTELAKELARVRKLGGAYARALEDDDAQKALIVNLSKELKTVQKELESTRATLYKLQAGNKIKEGRELSDDDLQNLGL